MSQDGRREDHRDQLPLHCLESTTSLLGIPLPDPNPLRSSRLQRVEIPEDEPWYKQAECRGSSSEIWFHETRGYETLAKKICNLCQVKEECLDYALRTRQYGGIWGGLTKRERERILRSRSA